jgi:hypothetical protein
MPIIQGCSVETCKKNYKELIQSGKKVNQAYAIMANTARKNINKCTLERQHEINLGYFFDAGDKE